MYRTKSWMLLVVALFVLPQLVEAQWVMAAHAAKNRIQQMKQKSGNGGYDVAIVLLEASPNAVYDKTLKTLQTHPEIKITKNDSKNGRIEISKDQLVAGFQITALGDKLTQLVIASNLSEKAESSPTSMVVEAVLRVCEQVNVKCSVEQN
jgi:hypothetical protein